VENRDLEKLVKGWRKHHNQVGDTVRKTLAAGEDPHFLVLCCSDSRIDVDEIFGFHRQGMVFQVRNVGGLFTRDAESGFVYALRHLKPRVIMVMHHTLCGGYLSLYSGELEDEIRGHVGENGGFEAKAHVESYIASIGRELPVDVRDRLIVEEGARIQANRLLEFLSSRYPDVHSRVKTGDILLLTLVYDLTSDEVYVVPEGLEGGDRPDRTPLSGLV
jgi:carbonic anhydrase